MDSDNKDRPDPEALLAAIQRAEKIMKTGKLKIFFGMAAGVGKTFEMLRAARQRQLEGIDVVVGVVETHGRHDTQALLEGLPVIPLKKIEYRDTVQYEMDLAAILERRPQLVLVDELAHTNVPGSHHPKRWQDVVDILDASIDVYTTVNVQHMESRKELIEGITGISIREMVPDSIIERANDIELIDITPQELLSRLKEGKVYLGTQAEIAAKNFFQEDRLTALREVALRFTAEKVDHDLHGMLSSFPLGHDGWLPGEKLMVAVSHSPFSQQLIRAARRLASIFDCPWIAVHVDFGERLSDEESLMLTKNIELARELGAEICTTSDPDIAQALQRIAHQRHVTQIILGRSPDWKLSDIFSGGTLIDRLASEARDIDLHVIRQEHIKAAVTTFKKKERTKSPFSHYFWTIAIVGAFSVIGWLIDPLAGYIAIGLSFLLCIMLLSLFVGKGPIMVAAFLSAAIWGAVFLPSLAEVGKIKFEHIALFIIYFFTAIILGIFATRIRTREMLLRRNEEQTNIIYEVVRLIASTPSTQSLIRSVEKLLGNLLEGECEIALKDINNRLAFRNGEGLFSRQKERAVALWVFQNNKPAGWSTATLPSVQNLYLPISGFQETVGIFAYHPLSKMSLRVEIFDLVRAILQQLGVYLERSMVEENVRREEYAKQLETIKSSILSSITKKTDALDLANIEQEKGDGDENITNRISISLEQLEESSDNINRIVNNILAISQLNASFFTIHRTLQPIRKLMEDSVANSKKFLTKHQLALQVPDNIVEGQFDTSLMELLFCNLLLNAAQNAPPNSTIIFSVDEQDNGFLFTVTDAREDAPIELIQKVMEQPYGSTIHPSLEVSLEWIIIKTIAERHHGWVRISKTLPHGLSCSVFIPQDGSHAPELSL